jgi:hypothetical protein
LASTSLEHLVLKTRYALNQRARDGAVESRSGAAQECHSQTVSAQGTYAQLVIIRDEAGAIASSLMECPCCEAYQNHPVIQLDPNPTFACTDCHAMFRDDG